MNIRKIRMPNFPSEISENIVRRVYFTNYNEYPNWDIKKGDLEIHNLRLEVKAFSSTGPISFGPNESWDKLYIVDCIRFMENFFIVYELPYSNHSEIWRQLKVNNHETIYDQYLQKRRPRINFTALYTQLRPYLKVIHTGVIEY